MYGVSSSGATLYFHYCCGKLVNIELSSVNAHCGKDHKMGTKACCETKFLSTSKASHDYFPSVLKFHYQGIINNQVFVFSDFKILQDNPVLNKPLPESLPPPTPIYITKRSFLI